MMKVDPQNYIEMRAWLARMVPEIFPPELLTASSDPVACLDQIAARSAAKARSGLAMAIDDIIEQVDGWPTERVAAIDRLLAGDDLPTLTEICLRSSKVVCRVVTRGIIKNDIEYYAVRNAIEHEQRDQEALWKLLSAYESALSS